MNENFFAKQHIGKTHIDEGALDYLIKTFNVKSMFDVGCGPGGMLKLAKEKGLEVCGIDGDPNVASTELDIITNDFSKEKYPKNIPGVIYIPVDLVWSCEFLEHVEEKYIPNYIDCFKPGKVLCITHALPGQHGGPDSHHVNLQTEDYWIGVFAAIGFKFSQKHTNELRLASTMVKNFIRTTGKVFVRT